MQLASQAVGLHMGHSPKKNGQNCDTEGKNSKCEFFNVIIWK